MIIINSAAYVIPEFRNELGAIPPCLLPLGNQKLLQYQVNVLRESFSERIVVSLPSSYEITRDEFDLLKTLDVETVGVPDEFTLAEALTYVLNIASEGEASLRLLHGDTLISDLPEQVDVIAVSRSSGDYEWEVEESGTERDIDELVWSGFFAFSSQREFLRALALSRGSFVKAVRGYSSLCRLTAVQCQEWLDLGHVNTYFSSRSKITTQRSFNTLKISDGVLYKSGVPAEKIQAEEHWFRTLPLAIKKYTPHLLDAGVLPDGDRFYALEYLPYLPLNELFVHGRNPLPFWSGQFELLRKLFMDARSAFDSVNGGLDKLTSDAISLYQQKTLNRIQYYERQAGFSAESVIGLHEDQLLTVQLIALECIKLSLQMKVVPAIIHGDLCFSNILYDSRCERIKVVDPRGTNAQGDFTIYGDQKYDLAKLAHSVIGMYDFIIAGRYTLETDDDGYASINFEINGRLSAIQDAFLDVRFIDEFSVKEIMPLVVILFISMLPLHADRPDRQKAMLLNAVRLYKGFVKPEPKLLQNEILVNRH